MRKLIHPTILFLVSLGIGLLINLAWGEHELVGDEADYLKLAEIFADSNRFGYEDNLAYRAPFYPVALGLVFKVFWKSLVVARVFNSVLAAAMATGAGLVAARITREKWPIYLAAGLMMLHSYWWLHQVVLMQENLAAALLVFSFVCWPHFGDRDRAITKRIRKHGLWVLASGILFGLSQLTKPSLLPLLLGFPILSLLLSSSELRRTQLAFALLFVGSSVLVMSAWTARNYSALDRFVPVTTGSGEVFWGSHAPETLANAPGQWRSVPLPGDLQTKLETAKAPQREILSSDLRWEAGKRSLGEAELSSVAYHLAMKIARLWSPSTFFESKDSGIVIKSILICMNTVILFLFGYSLLRNGSDRILLLSIFISLTLTSLVFWGSIRFLYVGQPLIAGLAAQSIFRIVYRRQQATNRQAA